MTEDHFESFQSSIFGPSLNWLIILSFIKRCGTLSSLTHYPVSLKISAWFFLQSELMFFQSIPLILWAFFFCKMILEELQKWISPCRKTLLSILLLTETTEIRIPRILQITHEVTYSYNVCLALLSSKVAVTTVRKGKVQRVEGKQKGEHKERVHNGGVANKPQTAKTDQVLLVKALFSFSGL